jgi:hypothetical protein
MMPRTLLRLEEPDLPDRLFLIVGGILPLRAPDWERQAGATTTAICEMRNKLPSLDVIDSEGMNAFIGNRTF